jgi:hypothetical protein
MLACLAVYFSTGAHQLSLPKIKMEPEKAPLPLLFLAF